VFRAGRTAYAIIIVEAADRLAAMVVFVESPVVGDIAGEAPTVVVAGLAVVRTVRTELPHYSLIAQLGFAHTQTQVVSAEIVLTNAGHAVTLIHTGEAYRRASGTHSSIILEVAIDWNAPFGIDI